MSETAENPALKELSFEVPIKNPESGKTNVLPIKATTIAKGKAQGKIKLEPTNFATLDLPTMIELFGAKKVYQVFVKPRFGQILATYTNEALTHEETDDKGVKVYSVESDQKVIIKEFSDLLSVLSFRGESKMALKRRLTDILKTEYPKLMEQFGNLPDEDEVSTEEEKQSIRDQTKQIKGQIKELRSEMAELKKSLEEKRAEDEPEEEEDKPAAVAA
jgi:hypothetical protein